MKIKFTVKKEERIDKAISSETQISRNEITELIKNSQCFVNGKVENKKSLIVKIDSLVEITIPEISKENTYIKIGQRVSHMKFGDGVILSYTGKSDDLKLHINFESYGKKWLVLSYAQLDFLK